MLTFEINHTEIHSICWGYVNGKTLINSRTIVPIIKEHLVLWPQRNNFEKSEFKYQTCHKVLYSILHST